MHERNTPQIKQSGRRDASDPPAEVFAFPDGSARIIRSHKLSKSDLERGNEIAKRAKNLGVYIDADIYPDQEPIIECVYTPPEKWTEITKPAPGLTSNTEVLAIPESLPYSLFDFDGCSSAEKADRIFLASVTTLEDDISRVGSYSKYFLDLYIERARLSILGAYRRYCDLEGPAILPKNDFEELLKVVTLYETTDMEFGQYKTNAEVSAFIARLLKYHLLTPYTDFMPELSVPGGVVACQCINLSNAQDAAIYTHHQNLAEFRDTFGREPRRSEALTIWYETAIRAHAERDKMLSLSDEISNRLSKLGSYSFWFPDRVDEWMKSVGSNFPITKVIEKRQSDRRKRIEADLPIYFL